MNVQQSTRKDFYVNGMLTGASSEYETQKDQQIQPQQSNMVSSTHASGLVVTVKWLCLCLRNTLKQKKLEILDER